jgi:stage III sporulation protein AG
MSRQDAWAVWMQRLKKLLGKYKFVFVVILAGIVLLLLPDLGGEPTQPEPEPVQPAVSDPFQVEEMESKLSQVLSKVEGAGEVTVVLTVKSTARQVLAQDGESSEREGEVESSLSTVVISKGSGGEETVSLQQLSPQYQGALVVCSGGDAPGVQLRLVEAVSALTGLGADKISVCKGK